ncbi:hypothetical protein PISMIDRAFT_483646 [Pisolithus microcarpus 441]|uniref:Uncharacterized protein n=1 Tax=Pisolithus microcarpus 441 TaxID=765257 RepID=A0A0C9ZJM8_9AGAM|nr:hypothetical protein PISMIDRAFT_483646 [Pisolithus microcarpus 441]
MWGGGARTTRRNSPCVRRNLSCESGIFNEPSFLRLGMGTVVSSCFLTVTSGAS